MITIQNDKNRQLYNNLFDKATKALKDNKYIPEAASPITNLESYFYYLKKLVEIDINYTILPLDEEPFTIDAETRSIKIPSAFSKSVGVAGDHTAETIWFKINRYFDFTDLDTQNIYIEWRHSKSGESNVSPVYTKDLTSEPGYIIFGWVLTDEMTKPGTIEFAVRFYTLNENEVIYSLGTLPAKINVSETLNFNLAEEYSTALETSQIQAMIKSRLVQSMIYGGEVSKSPIIIVDLDNSKFNPEVINEQVDLPTQLLITAGSEDAGEISYNWQKGSIGITRKTLGNISWGPVDENEGTIFWVFKLTEDSEINKNKDYYIKENESTYTEYNGDSTILMEELYERYSALEPKVIGYYRCEIINTVGAGVNEDTGESFPVNPSDPKYSIIIEVPGPVLPSYNKGEFPTYLEEMADGLSITLSPIDLVSVNGNILSYQWYKNKEEYSTEETVVVTEPGRYELYISSSRNGETIKDTEPAVYRITEHAKPAVILADSYGITLDGIYKPGILSGEFKQNPKLSFSLDSNVLSDKVKIQWINKDTGNSSETEELDTINGEYIIEYIPKETGHYEASIINIYNSDEAEAVVSEEFTIYNI